MRGSLEPLNEERVLRALRIHRVHRIDEIPERGVREAVRKAVGRALGMRAWSAVLESFALRPENFFEDRIEVAGSKALLVGRDVVKLLSGCREVSVLLLTLGEVWDAALDALVGADEAAEAWFLDALGTRMADSAARAAEARVASDMARAGLVRARRYRPGYGDFKLEAQGAICALLEAQRIGVRVNEAFALLPRKSLSTVVGWAERTVGAENEGEGGEGDDAD